MRITSVPVGTSSPAAGSWSTTVPGSCKGSSTRSGVSETTSPASSRIVSASPRRSPMTVGTVTSTVVSGSSLFDSRLRVRSQTPRPTPPMMSRTTSTGTHQLRSGSGGPPRTIVLAAAGGRSITCVLLAAGSTGVASTGIPRRTRSRSMRNSSADWYRFAGFLASARRITASRSGEMSPFSREGGTGCSSTCLDATVTADSPMNGGGR